MFSRLGILRVAALVAVGLNFALPARLAGAPGKWVWPVIPAEERTAPRPSGAHDVAAEILDWKILCDQRKEGFWDEYIRIKIHDPVVVEDLTRRTVPRYRRPLTSTIVARLTAPDGSVREFGEADCKVRTVAKWDILEFEEQTLVVPQIEAGSIVEFHLYRDIATIDAAYYYGLDASMRWRATVLQSPNASLRHAEIRWVIPPDDYWDSRLFAINAAGAKVEKISKRELRFEVRDLPAVGREPFTGPITDYAATLIWSSTATTVQNFAPYARKGDTIEVDTHVTGWAPFATFAYMVDTAQGRPTTALRKAAAQICEGATGEIEKAKRIHTHVQKLYFAFRKRAATPAAGAFTGNLDSLDLLLDSEKSAKLYVDPMDYFWLAVALYRAADLKLGVVLLPDRKLARLQKDQVAPVFLPRLAAAIRVGDEVHFSYPLDFVGISQNPIEDDRSFLPFDLLPWNTTGQDGLLGVLNEEKFMPVAPTPAEQSKTTSVGVFQLDAEGNLRGQARRTLTGQVAAQVRAEIFDEADGKQREFLLKQLKDDLPGTEVEITKLTGLGETEKPIELEVTLTWPGFATVAGDRLIFRPSVFRREIPAPLTAEKRRHPVHFPFPYAQMDSVGIKLPAGFKPEALPPPAVLPAGKALSVAVAISFEEGRRLLKVRRDFMSAILDIPAEAYPKLKEWFDARTALDQQEVVFVRSAPAAEPSGTSGK